MENKEMSSEETIREIKEWYSAVIMSKPIKTDFEEFLESNDEIKAYMKEFDKKRLDLHEKNLMRIAWDASEKLCDEIYR